MHTSIRRTLLWTCILSPALCGCSGTPTTSPGNDDGEITMKLTSPSFEAGATIPLEHTGDGDDVSPKLTWDAPPAGTKSLVLICDDPDAPAGTWVHWVLFNIPPDVTELPENMPTDKELKWGARQGKNSWEKDNIGYRGPNPPRGMGAHRYYFKLYALDKKLDLPAGATKKDVVKAMEEHILGKGELMGRFGH
jgi:Raf kinase inhibitor-like YbhB/YbcL family protein